MAWTCRLSPLCRTRAGIGHSWYPRRTVGPIPPLIVIKHSGRSFSFQKQTVTAAKLTPRSLWRPVEGDLSYKDLLELRRMVEGSIVVAIDVEGVHHTNPGEIPPLTFTTVSEIGMAWLDMRTLDQDWHQGSPKTLASKIQARHFISNRWAHITRHTCPSVKCRENLKKRADNRHSPYEGMFALSEIVPHAKVQKLVKRLLRRLARSTKQQVYLLFWGAYQDVHLLARSDAFPSPIQQFTMWDLQSWKPIKHRFYPIAHQDPLSARTFAEDIGLGMVSGDRLHNAANDAWICLMGFLRCLMMTEPFFNKWVNPEFLYTTKLEPLADDWLDRSILQKNQSLDPTLPDVQAVRQRLYLRYSYRVRRMQLQMKHLKSPPGLRKKLNRMMQETNIQSSAPDGTTQTSERARVRDY